MSSELRTWGLGRGGQLEIIFWQKMDLPRNQHAFIAIDFDVPRPPGAGRHQACSRQRSSVWLTSARSAGARTGLARKPQPRPAVLRRRVAPRSAEPTINT